MVWMQERPSGRSGGPSGRKAMHRRQGVMEGILKRSKFYGPRCFEQSFGDLRREYLNNTNSSLQRFWSSCHRVKDQLRSGRRRGPLVGEWFGGQPDGIDAVGDQRHGGAGLLQVATARFRK